MTEEPLTYKGIQQVSKYSRIMRARLLMEKGGAIHRKGKAEQVYDQIRAGTIGLTHGF